MSLVAAPQPLTGAAPLARRLAWVTAARLVLLSLLLGLLGLLNVKSPDAWQTFTIQTALGTLAVAFAVTALYAALLRNGQHMQRLVVLQLVVDPMLWTVIVYLSGGPSSGATSLYGLSSVTGAMLTGFRGAAVAFGMGVLCFSTLLAGLYFGVIPPPPDQPGYVFHAQPEDWVYAGVVHLLAMFVVTVLAGNLAERLRVTGGQLVLAEERADHAERLAILGRVATALAHEIRNPLGSISGSIQLLRVSKALTPEEQRLCAIIVREASRLNDLVTDMMNLARPQRPQLSCVDAASTARDVVALAAQSGRAVSDVRVRYEGVERAPICADSAQLRQLIWNLVRNAVQASSAGREVRVSVLTRGSGQDSEAELTVEDEGVGLSEQAKERIFDAFFTTRAQGTGVGLAVVKRIADAAMLRQLIWNLVRNAVQASSAGSAVTVTVRADLEPGTPVELCVQDQGVGLSEEAKTRIFDAFFTTRAQGTGVGLAVVKRIADDHGFSISVVSESGRGATFSVGLGPRSKAAEGSPVIRQERRSLFPERA